MRPMLRPSFTLALAALTVVLGAGLFDPALAQSVPTDRQKSVRGRVVVSPELLAATEWPVDAARAAALRTPANTRRPQGRKLHHITESTPAISIVIEGDDVRPDNLPPKTLVVEGMRFVPGQALLTRPGPIAIENRQGIPLSVVDASKRVLKTLAVGETAQVSLPEGVNVLVLKELPYAAATVRVLKRGRFLSIDDSGELSPVDLTGGDYYLSFYLGANQLRREKMTIPENGQRFIDATISENTVVDVSIKDAAIQIAIPLTTDDIPPEE